jgi:hypothetical protein
VHSCAHSSSAAIRVRDEGHPSRSHTFSRPFVVSSLVRTRFGVRCSTNLLRLPRSSARSGWSWRMGHGGRLALCYRCILNGTSFPSTSSPTHGGPTLNVSALLFYLIHSLSSERISGSDWTFLEDLTIKYLYIAETYTSANLTALRIMRNINLRGPTQLTLILGAPGPPKPSISHRRSSRPMLYHYSEEPLPSTTLAQLTHVRVEFRNFNFMQSDRVFSQLFASVCKEGALEVVHFMREMGPTNEDLYSEASFLRDSIESLV